jgi:acyl-CoA synthetase (AMP-forming)/AMP-acid ligase II
VLGIEDHARGLGGEPRLLGSVGRIVDEARIEIRRDGASADADEPAGSGAEADAGGPALGEVAVSGPMVTRGYWNAEERTDLGKSFDGAVLLTGDVGFIVDDRLVLVDRRSDMLISGGYNVYPGEIESAVRSSPGLRDVVAVGLPDERWGQRIVLAYTTTTGIDLDAAEQAALHDRLTGLAPHKRPKATHFHAVLPLGATGKIDRRAIATRLSSAQPAAAGHPLSGASDERPSAT